jgi:hypothetical protein
MFSADQRWLPGKFLCVFMSHLALQHWTAIRLSFWILTGFDDKVFSTARQPDTSNLVLWALTVSFPCRFAFTWFGIMMFTFAGIGLANANQHTQKNHLLSDPNLNAWLYSTGPSTIYFLFVEKHVATCQIHTYIYILK